MSHVHAMRQCRSLFLSFPSYRLVQRTFNFLVFISYFTYFSPLLFYIFLSAFCISSVYICCSYLSFQMRRRLSKGNIWIPTHHTLHLWICPFTFIAYLSFIKYRNFPNAVKNDEWAFDLVSQWAKEGGRQIEEQTDLCRVWRCGFGTALWPELL